MKQRLGKACKTINRFKWIVAAFVFAINILAGLIFMNSPAYAAGEEYGFNYNKNDEDWINKDLGIHGGDDDAKDDHGVYNKTAAYARGGPFQESQPVRFTPVKGADRKYEHDNVYLYKSGTFVCQGYRIQAYMQLNLPKPIKDGNAKGNVGYASIRLPDGRLITPQNGDIALSEDQVVNALPGICRPANYRQNNGLTAFNLPYSGGLAAFNAGNASNGGGAGGGSANTETNGDEELGCDASFDNPLTWVLCPVVDMMSDMVQGLDKVITDQITIDSDKVFCSSDKVCDAYHAAWTSFRNIALGLLVVAGLIVLIGQALGMEILDAYTIRKVLPRILVVTILITLSWTLAKFLVELFNDLGYGIRHLILLPFSKLEGELGAAGFDLGLGGGVANFFEQLGIVGAGVGLWVGFGGIGVLFSYLATGALAVLLAVISLDIRAIALIGGAIFMPILLIGYILPNTINFTKSILKGLFVLLFAGPLILAAIALGRVFAAIAMQNPNFLYQTIAFISYVTPYFAAPIILMKAGGVISPILGAVNKRSSGAFGALGNYRKGKTKERIHAARTGGLYRNDFGEFKVPGMNKRTSIGKMANAAAGGLLDADEVTPYWMGRAKVPGFRRNPKIVDEALSSQAVEHSANLAKKAGLHYEGAWALMGKREDSYGKGLKWSDETQEKLEKAGFYKKDKDGKMQWQAPTGDAGIRQLSQILQKDEKSDSARRAGINLAASAEKFGTFKSDDETRRADITTAAMMTAASQGRLEDEDYVNAYNSMAGSEAKSYMYPGFDKRFAAKRNKAMLDMAQGYRAEQRDGKLVAFDNKGNAVSAFDQKHWIRDDSRNGVLKPSDAAIDNVETMKGQALISAKGETIERSADTIAYLAGAGQVGPLSLEQQSWRQQIAAGFANSYDDAGSRQAWLEVARKAGMSGKDLTYSGRDMDPVMNDRLNPKPKDDGGGGGAGPGH